MYRIRELEDSGLFEVVQDNGGGIDTHGTLDDRAFSNARGLGDLALGTSATAGVGGHARDRSYSSSNPVLV